MIIIDLFTVGGPLVDVFNVVTPGHLLLDCRIVTTTLLFVLHALLLDLSNVLWSLISERSSPDWILSSYVLRTYLQKLLFTKLSH